MAKNNIKGVLWIIALFLIIIYLVFGFVLDFLKNNWIIIIALIVVIIHDKKHPNKNI